MVDRGCFWDFIKKSLTTERIAAFWGGKQLKSADVWSAIGDFVSDFSSACKSDYVVVLYGLDRGMSWLPHSLGVFKLNVDALVFKGGRQVRAGFVVKRSDGSLVFAATTVIQGGFAVDVAEALAVLDSLRLATSKGLLPLFV
ncbi:hypothetical protein ACOSQ2_011807 [Xanthoceras sorbifolium]